MPGRNRLAAAEQIPEQLMDYLQNFEDSYEVEGTVSLSVNQGPCLHSLLQSDSVSSRGKVCIAALSRDLQALAPVGLNLFVWLILLCFPLLSTYRLYALKPAVRKLL